MRANALAVMAKAPEAGQVKTRMLPALSTEQAAELCRALLLDQLKHLQGLALADLYVAFTSTAAAPSMMHLAPPAFCLFAQAGTVVREGVERIFANLSASCHKYIG